MQQLSVAYKGVTRTFTQSSTTALPAAIADMPCPADAMLAENAVWLRGGSVRLGAAKAGNWLGQRGVSASTRQASCLCGHGVGFWDRAGRDSILVML